MALRRPPTRVELKADDIAEYEEIMKERALAAEEVATASANDSTYVHSKSGKKLASGATPSPAGKRKPSKAERIGIGKAR